MNKARAKILSGSSIQVSHLRGFRALFAHRRLPTQQDESLSDKLPSKCGRYKNSWKHLRQSPVIKGVLCHVGELMVGPQSHQVQLS